jgi:phosphatidylglycerol:prolipoprotein diacylglycerol transferase
MAFFMLPVIFSLGPVTIYSLALFIGIGFFLAAFIIWRRLRDLGFNEEEVIDFVLLSALAGIFFAKVVNYLANQNFFGFTLGGIFAGVILVLYLFQKRKNWSFWQVADELVFALLPFSVLFQVGLFLDGSSPGRPTGMPWGIYFPGSLVRTLPVPIFLGVAIFVVWLFILQIERHWRTWEWYRSKNNGLLALVFLGLISLANFGVAFWRQSDLYWYWAEIIGSGGLFWMSLVILYFRSGRIAKRWAFESKGGRHAKQKETKGKKR